MLITLLSGPGERRKEEGEGRVEKREKWRARERGRREDTDFAEPERIDL